MAGTNVTKPPNYLVLQEVIPKVMTAFENKGKNLLTEAKLWKKAKDFW